MKKKTDPDFIGSENVRVGDSKTDPLILEVVEPPGVIKDELEKQEDHVEQDLPDIQDVQDEQDEVENAEYSANDGNVDWEVFSEVSSFSSLFYRHVKGFVTVSFDF